MESCCSAACGRVYGVEGVVFFFFSKTVIRLLEKEPYHSSVCQIFQN